MGRVIFVCLIDVFFFLLLLFLLLLLLLFNCCSSTSTATSTTTPTTPIHHHQSTTTSTTTNPRPHLHVSVGQVWHRSYGRSNGRWRPPKMEEPTTIHPVHERHSKHTGRIVRHLEEQWFVGRHDRRLHVSCSSCFYMFLHVSSRFYTFLHVSTRFYTFLHVSPCFSMFLHVSPCFYMFLHVFTCSIDHVVVFYFKWRLIDIFLLFPAFLCNP